MCNGVAHAGILAVTLQAVVAVPEHASEAEVAWTAWMPEDAGCRDACVRKLLERSGARAYRHGAAAPRRVQRQPEHASPPPQHARKTTFHLSVLLFNMLRRRGVAKGAGFSAASPRARKSHTFHREQGLFGRARPTNVKDHQRRSESGRKHTRRHSFEADRRKPWHSRYLIYLSAETTALGLQFVSRLHAGAIFVAVAPRIIPATGFFCVL